jgi:O-antigen/teichoic acid export membrane protein
MTRESVIVVSLGSKYQEFFKRIRSSDLVKNIMMVGGGLAAAQAITLAVTPFLSRLYGAEAYGVSAAYVAIINVISPIATMGYSNAIVIPKEEEEALAVARASVLFGFFSFLVSLLLVVFFKTTIASISGLDSHQDILYLIPVSMLIMSLLSTANQSAIRAGLFKHKATAYVGSVANTNVTKLSAGFFVPTGAALVLLTEVGKIVNLVLQLLIVPKNGVLHPRFWFGYRGVRGIAIKYYDFALYRMPQSIIRALGMGLPVLILASFFDSGVAGQYSIAILLLGAPVMLLGDAVGEVFYPKITRSIQSDIDRARRLVIAAMLILAALGSLGFGVIIIWGGELIPWFLGAGWEVAGEYSRWVSVWMLFMLIARPAIAAVPAMKLQRGLLIYEVAITMTRGAALYTGAKLESDIWSLAIFCITNALGYISLSLFVLHKMKRK